MPEERNLNLPPDEPETQPNLRRVDADGGERDGAHDEHGHPLTDEEIRRLHAEDAPLDNEGDGYGSDEDVPFRLPHVDDMRGEARQPLPMEEETDEVDVEAIRRAEEEEGAARQRAREEGRSVHNQPTLAIPRVPDTLDPNLTLPGSGGLDPNPDFSAGMTMPAMSQNTQANRDAKREANVQSGRTMPSSAYQQDLGQTMPHQAVPQQAVPQQAVPHQAYGQPQSAADPAHAQYQRPAGVPAGAPTIPPPPAQGASPRRRPGSRRARRRMPGCLMVFLVMTLTFCGGSTLMMLLFGGVAYARVGEMAAEAEQRFADYRQFQSTFIYDRNGVSLYEVFNEGRRVQVDFADFPPALINATIANEDDSFWSNTGIDFNSTMRGFLGFVGITDDTGGGSTITQQLVRNVLFDAEYRAERSVQRKFEEIMLALALTGRMSKEDILELYLNEIYYGNLAYGAQAAAQTYFGKNVQDLTLGEAALLATLPSNPVYDDPLNPDATVQTRVFNKWVTALDAMLRQGYITQQERDDAIAAGLTFNTPDIPLRAPHFTVYAQKEAEQILLELGYPQEEVVAGGYSIYTTVDTRINDFAQRVAADQVAALSGQNVTNAAVVVMTPLTGEIVAMVGSIDYESQVIDGRFNVTVGLRQPGSTMKPFNYAAAIEQGMTPGDVIWDTQTEIGIPGSDVYRPVNYDGAFHGPMTMRTALANSYNIPAVQTLRRVGVPNLLGIMQRFGVSTLGNDASFYGLSLTLGGGEVSPLELTNGYAVFANQGSYVRATSIRCILDSDDNILYEYENGCPRGSVTASTVERPALGRQAIDPRIAFLITSMLSDNPARTPAMGSNSVLNTGGLETAVKTGTTNDFKDNWTIGYTANVAVGVWVGNNNGDPMRNVSGLAGAAPIWNQVITGIYNNQEYLASFAVNGTLLPDQYPQPSGITLQRICDLRVLSDPATGCNPSFNEFFLDYPAGIPDPAGNLVYPAAQQPTPVNAGGVVLQEYQPGIYRALVMPMPPNVSAAIQIQVGAGQIAPPAPTYCLVPNELAASAAGAREQLFIMPPLTDASAPNDPVYAEQYARGRGLAYLPTIACTPELLAAGGGGFSGGGGAITAVITSPRPGDVLTGQVPIMGTVDLAGARSYKIEIIGGQFADWTTLGTEHPNSVINGVLENLYVPIQPGQYQIRLVVIDQNANIALPPYIVPFTVP